MAQLGPTVESTPQIQGVGVNPTTDTDTEFLAPDADFQTSPSRRRRSRSPKRHPDGTIEEDPDGILIYHPVIPRGWTKKDFIGARVTKSHASYKLDLRSIQLEAIPAVTWGLTKLKTLWVDQNRICSVPSCVGGLSSLINLKLCDNNLETIPETLGDCAQLQVLMLSDNKLVSIPSTIGNLTNLIVLDLARNNLIGLPFSAAHISRHCDVDLTGNKLEQHPAEVTKRGWRSAFHRYLKEFLTSTRSRRLNLTNFELLEIPHNVVNATSITKLHLDNNRMSKLERLDNLCALQEISFQDTKVAVMPECFAVLPLKKIVFDLHSVRSPPTEVLQRGSMAIVAYLRACHAMSSTHILELPGLGLSALPWAFENPKAMLELHLSQNKLVALPDNITTCRQLRLLDLNSNDFTAFPSVISSLVSLSCLKMERNQLQEFPEWMSTQTQLTKLFLAKNRIETIPFTFMRLPLVEISLLGNPFDSPFKEIAAQGMKYVQAYLLMFGKGDGVMDLEGLMLTGVPREALLDKLQVLRIKNNEFRQLDTRITEAPLTKLDCSANKISTLPPELENMTLLKHLNISENKVRPFPDVICRVTSLTHLEMSNNGLYDMAEEIGALAELQVLLLSYNRIPAFPEGLTQCTKLRIVDVSHNAMRAMPAQIGVLTDLQTLILTGNPVREIVPDIRRCHSLEQLWIRETKIYILPPPLGVLRDTLQTLVFNEVDSMQRPPESVLVNSTHEILCYLYAQYTANEQGTLDLSTTGVQSWNHAMIQDIRAYSGLRIVRFSNMSLTALPDALGTLIFLEELTADHNYVKAIPRLFKSLRRLTILNMPNNSITDMPECLGVFTNLKVLNLATNRLASLFTSGLTFDTHETIPLSNLEFRKAADYRNSEAGVTVGHSLWNVARRRIPIPVQHRLHHARRERKMAGLLGCYDLEILNVSENNIAEIPAQISQLSRLVELRMSSNMITAFHIEVANLPLLRILDLSDNILALIPPHIGQLTNITELYLAHNKLATVPHELSDMGLLSTLDLSHNLMTVLPENTLLNIETSLTSLSLTGNPIEDPPPQVVNAGGAALFAHLHNIRRAKMRSTYHVTGSEVDTVTIDPVTLGGLVSLQLSWTSVSVLPTTVSSLFKLQELILVHNQFTELPQTLQALTNLQLLDVSYNMLTVLPFFLGGMTKLKRLRVQHNAVAELHSDLTGLHSLKDLNLSHNHLEFFPRGAGWLQHLRIMDLSYNHFPSFPKSISFARRLLTLNVAYNRINTVPENIWKLQKLKHLVASHNFIDALPTSIGACTGLRSLILDANRLSAIPRTSWFLTRLEELSLRQNVLMTIPKELYHVVSLTSLDVGANPFLKMPDGVVKLSNLTKLTVNEQHLFGVRTTPELQKAIVVEVLDVSHVDNIELETVQIDERLPVTNVSIYIQRLLQSREVTSLDLSGMNLMLLPNEVMKLDKLQELDIHGNFISELSASIKVLTNLRALNLSRNHIEELPDEIAKLTQLRKVDISENPIVSLPETFIELGLITEVFLGGTAIERAPEELTALPHLHRLALSDTKLTEVSPSFSCLTELTVLQLSRTKLTAFPEVACFMSSVSAVFCATCRISAIPDQIGLLSSLRELDLRSNMLRELPDAMNQLSNLLRLNLSSNVVTRVKGEFFARVTNLERLDLSGNQILNLPDNINDMQGLQRIDFRFNGLTELPYSFAAMIDSLHTFGYENNPLEDPPTEVLDRGTAGIKDYLSKFHSAMSTGSLNLAFHGLSELVLNTEKLHHLRRLDATGNTLEQLPDEITMLPSLEEFSCRHNFLQVIQPAFTAMTSLKILDISQNLFVSFPRVLRHPNLSRLESLNVSGNPFRYLVVQNAWIETHARVQRFLHRDSFTGVLYGLMAGKDTSALLETTLRVWRLTVFESREHARQAKIIEEKLKDSAEVAERQ